MSQQMMQQIPFSKVPKDGEFLYDTPFLEGGGDWPYKKTGDGEAIASSGRSYHEPTFDSKNADTFSPDEIVVYPYQASERKHLPMDPKR